MTPEQPATTLPLPAFTALLDVLQSVDRPLGDICHQLFQTVAGSAPSLSLGSSIAALLQDDLLPEASQRLVAIYLLYHMIVTRPIVTPGVPTPPSAPAVDRLIESPLTIVLFELIDERQARLPEQLFLSHLLSHSQTNSSDLPVPAQIAQAPAETLWNALEDAMGSGAAVPKLNMSSLRALWKERHPDPPCRHVTLPPVSGVVRDPDPLYISEQQQHQQHQQQAHIPLQPCKLAEELGDVVTLEDFAPAFVRLPPPFLLISEESKELRWIDPEPLHEIVWDPDMGIKGERGSELRDIIARALKTPIPESQQARVLSQLEADPKLVHLCGLTPQKLPDLVQNNAELATQLLLKLISSKQMPQYFSALVNMEMNRHSMDVVNRLTSSMHLPSEFVQSYISNCIRSCNNIPDKSGQLRMVRFVCIFIKNLIKSKAVDPQDLSIEVQAFCIEYSRYVAYPYLSAARSQIQQ